MEMLKIQRVQEPLKEPRSGSKAFRSPLFWAAAAAVWTGLALLSGLQTSLALLHQGEQVNWVSLFSLRLADWYTCGIFVPALGWLAVTLPVDSRSWPLAVPLHIGASILGAILKYLIFLPISGLILPQPIGLSEVLAGSFIFELMAFWAVIALLHALVFHEREEARARASSALQLQLAEAKLNALRSQLNPHFLLNTLNSIAALVNRKPGAAELMLERLSNLLRKTLHPSEGHEIALKGELGLLMDYVEIMKVRFPNLAFELDLPDGVDMALVPQFILQPLVENAVTHGMTEGSESIRVSLSARRVDAQLLLSIADNGPGIGARTRGGSGLGLSNSRDRLEQLYGDAARISMHTEAGGGVRVELVLPFREAPPGGRECPNLPGE